MLRLLWAQQRHFHPHNSLDVRVYNPRCHELNVWFHYIGLLSAPTDVNVDQVSVESVNVSWTPPFTLNEVPILMYTVYITSQGYTETMNTTETNITLERPCASTTYEISAWNEVGEGDIATYGEIFIHCKVYMQPNTYS